MAQRDTPSAGDIIGGIIGNLIDSGSEEGAGS